MGLYSNLISLTSEIVSGDLCECTSNPDNVFQVAKFMAVVVLTYLNINSKIIVYRPRIIITVQCQPG